MYQWTKLDRTMLHSYVQIESGDRPTASHRTSWCGRRHIRIGRWWLGRGFPSWVWIGYVEEGSEEWDDGAASEVCFAGEASPDWSHAAYLLSNTSIKNIGSRSQMLSLWQWRAPSLRIRPWNLRYVDGYLWLGQCLPTFSVGLSDCFAWLSIYLRPCRHSVAICWAIMVNGDVSKESAASCLDQWYEAVNS